MEPTRKLSNEDYREKVRRARSMTPEQRVMEGCRLSDLGLEAMKNEIRADFPDAPETEVQRILDLRIAVMRIAKGKVPEVYRHLL